MTQKYWNSRWK